MIEKIVNNKNILVSGEIASGKTRNVLFPVVDELINNKESMFIVDSKEEYVNNYYNKLKDNGYNVHLVDLRNIKNSESWNPLLYPYQLYKEGNRDLALETLDKIIPGVANDDTLLYGPEIKFFSNEIETDNKFRLENDNIYFVGDGAGKAGNIVTAAATGLVAARDIINNLK